MPMGVPGMTLRVRIASLCIVLLPAGPVRAQEEPPHAHGAHTHHLGTVEFPNPGSAAAQAPFLRGVALLHSFEYEDAADALQESQRADPTFGLAYWLEAITHSRLLWGREDTVAARAVLRRLGPTPEARLALARTPREREWGAAVEALYVDADQSVRARAWADSLRAMAQREPDDHEAAAFASIALQMAIQSGGVAPDQRTMVLQEAIGLADRVFRANAAHPGAAHYLIHAYDDPDVAAQGLDVARAYAAIAPDAQHALHMPSHIFVQVGLWDDVVASNERSWAASREWVARRNGSPTELDFHSLEWLQHGYLQQGRYRAARALIDTAQAVLAGADLTNSVDPHFVVQRLAFRHAAETRAWSTPLPVPRLPANARGAESRYAFFSTLSHYQAAVGSILQRDTAAAALNAFRRFHAERPPMGYAAVGAKHVDALLAHVTGDTASAIDMLAAAAALESDIPPVGPPAALPTLEWLGDLLLAAGRYAEAVDAYERALRRWPLRSASLLGLARAQTALGDEVAAAGNYQLLLRNWHAADADLPALHEARRGGAQ